MCQEVHVVIRFLQYRLKEKFQVHSQPEKAASLEELTHTFLSLHLEKNYPHSDAHYGFLLFLLTISQSPVNRDYVGGPESPSRQGGYGQYSEGALNISSVHTG